MKKSAVFMMSVLVSAAAFAAPGKPGVREILRDKEARKVEIVGLKGTTPEQQAQKLSTLLESIAQGRAGRAEINAAITKSPVARQTAERLARADEVLRDLNKNDFPAGDVDAAIAAVKTNVEFLALGNRLSQDVPGTLNAQKAALLKMFEIDIMAMSKEERASYVKVMTDAINARTSPSMDGDAALAKVLTPEKLRELINCKV